MYFKNNNIFYLRLYRKVLSYYVTKLSSAFYSLLFSLYLREPTKSQYDCKLNLSLRRGRNMSGGSLWDAGGRCRAVRGGGARPHAVVGGNWRVIKYLMISLCFVISTLRRSDQHFVLLLF